jgi:flagellar motility protein MotE (MotC chaperone)
MPQDKTQDKGALPPAEVEEKKSGKAKTILVLVGGFFLSYAVICAGMFYLLNTLQPQAQITEQAAKDSAGTVSGAQVSDNSAAASAPKMVIPEIDLTEYGLPASDMIPADSVKVAIAKLVEDRNIARNALAEVQRNLASKQQKADSLQQELAGLLENLDDLDASRISRLAKIFESMKADAAAPVIAQLSDDVTVSILMKMKERPAAKILSEMPVSRAAAISRLISQKVLEG